MNPTKFSRTTDFMNLCNELSEHLSNLSGDDLAEIANKILSDHVTYNAEDNQMFTIEGRE